MNRAPVERAFANGGRSPAITAVGCAVPAHAHRQDDIAEFMVLAHGFGDREARRLRELYRLTRIEQRHSVLADFGRRWPEFDFFPRHERLLPAPTTARRMEVFTREALPLALDASRQLFDRAGPVAPADVDHLLVVSCTGAFAPGLDGYLVESLGLRNDIGRTLIGFQGCHAGLSALRLAARLAEGRPDTATLIVCVELATIHFQIDPTPENLLANALFADGAAAALVAGSALLERGNGGGPAGARLEILDTRTLLRHANRDSMVWTIGDAGFTLHLSGLLPRRIAADLDAALLPIAGAGRDETAPALGFQAVHPGGAAILDGVERVLGLERDSLHVSRDVLRRFGNMSSPTIFFVLQEILANDRIEGQGLALAFGPGLTIEAARLRKC